MQNNEVISSLDISKLTTHDRREVMSRLLRYQKFFADSLKQFETQKRTRTDLEKTEQRIEKYYRLLNKVGEKCGAEKIGALSGLAAVNPALGKLGGGRIKQGGAGMAKGDFGPLSSMEGITSFISSILPSGATDKEINEQLIAMLQTTVAMLEKCNITENDIKSALSNTVHAISEIKNKYGDDLDENRLGKLVQDECASWILENMEKGVDYDKWSNKIEKSIGESAWNKMTENSQIFIVTAEVLYEQMDCGDTFDYSVICMAAAKALEVEVARRYCGGYIAYLRENSISPIPSGVLDNSGGIVSEESFVFGGLADMTGYYIKNGEVRLLNKYASDSEIFLNYAVKELFISEQREECRELVRKHVRMIDKVRSDYRNPAAHKSVMKAGTAKECLDYLVDIEHVLGVMIDDCKW